MSLDSKKTILFYNLASVDSDRKAIPFIKSAQYLGFKTIVATHSAQTQMLCGDINEVIDDDYLNRLQQLVIKHRVDFVMTVNSRLTPLIAELNKNCSVKNFPSESAITINNKDACADFAKNFNLSSPKHWIIKSNVDWGAVPNNMPIILKPTFSTGAIDTYRFASAAYLKEILSTTGLWCEGLKRKINLLDFYTINTQKEYFGNFLIQEHIAYKKQIGLEILIVNGSVHLVHSAQIYTIEPEMISAYAHVGPVYVPKNILNNFQNFVTALELKNCHMTPDFLIDANDNWYLIDANLNVGGEGLIDAIQARDLNYPLESLKAFFELPYSLTVVEKFSCSYSASAFNSQDLPLIETAETFDELQKNIVERKLNL